MISTWFGVGLLPGPTGTWGSAAAVVVAEALRSRWGLAPVAVLAVAATAAGIPAATRTAALLGVKDPKEVVVDEVAGQAITLLGLHAAFPGLSGGAAAGGVLAAFFLFRLLDIWKPGPVGALERLPGGTGIVLDDVAAGLLGAIFFVALAAVVPS
jgi:phosphatidylglycerophosphatase A